jgi:hypothetical protein
LLLDNPALGAWFRESEANLLGLVDTVPLNDTVARDRIYTILMLLRKLKLSLNAFVEEGKQSEEDWANFLELRKKGVLGGILGG